MDVSWVQTYWYLRGLRQYLCELLETPGMVFSWVMPRVVSGCHISDSVRIHAYGLVLISFW